MRNAPADCTVPWLASAPLRRICVSLPATVEPRICPRLSRLRALIWLPCVACSVPALVSAPAWIARVSPSSWPLAWLSSFNSRPAAPNRSAPAACTVPLLLKPAPCTSRSPPLSSCPAFSNCPAASRLRPLCAFTWPALRRLPVSDANCARVPALSVAVPRFTSPRPRRSRPLPAYRLAPLAPTCRLPKRRVDAPPAPQAEPSTAALPLILRRRLRAAKRLWPAELSSRLAALTPRSRSAVSLPAFRLTPPTPASSPISPLALSSALLPLSCRAPPSTWLPVYFTARFCAAPTRPFSSIRPEALRVKSLELAASPRMRTPTPSSVASRRMRLAYMPPSAVESMA